MLQWNLNKDLQFILGVCICVHVSLNRFLASLHPFLFGLLWIISLNFCLLMSICRTHNNNTPTNKRTFINPFICTSANTYMKLQKTYDASVAVHVYVYSFCTSYNMMMIICPAIMTEMSGCVCLGVFGNIFALDRLKINMVNVFLQLILYKCAEFHFGWDYLLNTYRPMYRQAGMQTFTFVLYKYVYKLMRNKLYMVISFF